MSTIKDFVSVTGLFAGCSSGGESFALRDANLFDVTKRLPTFAIEHLQREHAIDNSTWNTYGSTLNLYLSFV